MWGPVLLAEDTVDTVYIWGVSISQNMFSVASTAASLMRQRPFSKGAPGESRVRAHDVVVECVLKECIVSKVGCSDAEAGQVHFPV